MLSRLREHFGTAGLIVAVVALVAALGGGAYAASSGSDDGHATASAKGKPGPRGPKGPKGPRGDAGPAGQQGPAGPAGAKGDAGANGANGSNGAKGATGPTGPEGEAGEPWTPNGTLPAGATETGIWGLFQSGALGKMNIPISFPIPLVDPPEVILLNEGEASKPGCPGVVSGIPQADSGKLCVYTDALEEVTVEKFVYPKPPEGSNFGGFNDGAANTGTILRVNVGSAGSYIGGKWAVTG